MNRLETVPKQYELGGGHIHGTRGRECYVQESEKNASMTGPPCQGVARDWASGERGTKLVPPTVGDQLPVCGTLTGNCVDANTSSAPRHHDDILLKESRAYETSTKFSNKIKEDDRQWADPSVTHEGRFGAIHAHTQSIVGSNKRDEITVLELGFGAGTNMLVLHQHMQRIHQNGHVCRIELTRGWVEHKAEV